MARLAPIVYLNCLIIWASMASLVSAITLNQTILKPRHTKFSSSTTDPGSGSLVTVPYASTEDMTGAGYYRLFNKVTGSTCILLKVDAVVEVLFEVHGIKEAVDSFIPDRALIEGSCEKEDSQLLRISWNGYCLFLNFEKTSDGERWFIKNVELSVSTDSYKFHGISKRGNNPIKLYHKGTLTPTPAGRSYACEELDIDLVSYKDDNPPPGLAGYLLLRLLQVQPFMSSGENFGPAFDCKNQTLVRGETAAISGGSTFIIPVLLMTINGLLFLI